MMDRVLLSIIQGQGKHPRELPEHLVQSQRNLQGRLSLVRGRSNMSFIEIEPSVHVATPGVFANHTGARVTPQGDLPECLLQS